MGMKQVKANVPEEIHRRLRIALAEDQDTFAGWLSQKIIGYLQSRGSLVMGKDKALMTSYLHSTTKKEPKGKRKGKEG